MGRLDLLTTDWRRVRPLPPGTIDCLDCGALVPLSGPCYGWCVACGGQPPRTLDMICQDCGTPCASPCDECPACGSWEVSLAE